MRILSTASSNRRSGALGSVRRALLAQVEQDAHDLVRIRLADPDDERALVTRFARRLVARLLLRPREALAEPDGRELEPTLARIFGVAG